MFKPLPETTAEFPGQDLAALEPYLKELAEAPLDQAGLGAWLGQWSAFVELISEHGAWLHIEMSRDTDAAAKEEAYLHFVNQVVPGVRIWENRLTKKFVESNLSYPGMETPLRLMRNELEIFREANLPLFAEDAGLMARHGRIEGAQTVTYGGKETTLAELAALQESKDRSVREETWRLAWDRRQADRGPLDALLDEMLVLRKTMATQAGFGGYLDFRFRQLGRFDYTPADCRAFHRAIEKSVLPLREKLLEKRRRALGLKDLRPWDMGVDLFSDRALKPFETAAQLSDGVQQIFSRLDPELSGFFRAMRAGGLLDLEARKGKRGGGFCSSLARRKAAFILMNAAGRADDVFTLLHESGHAFQDFLMTRRQPLAFQREIPIEFAETASMSMELLAFPLLDPFFTAQEADEVFYGQIEKIVGFLPYMSTIDLFQHWLYEHPGAGHGERHAAYLDLSRRFLPGLDWSGLETIRESAWQQKLHIFCAPLYYVEYGLAQLGALQVWRNSLGDPAGALKKYKEALSLGGTRSLPQLFEAAGARFSFGEDLLEELMAFCAGRLDALAVPLK